MEQYNRYEFEGEVVEVPVYWDDHLQREVEDYEDYCKQPGHTPSGRPVLLTFEDACPYADMVDDDPASVDCGFHRWPRTVRRWRCSAQGLVLVRPPVRSVRGHNRSCSAYPWMC